MLHLKRTLHKNFMQTLKNISTELQDSKQLFLVRLNSPFRENLGETLYSLVLLVIMPALLMLVCILNLSFLIAQISMKLYGLLRSMAEQELESLYTSCHSEDVQKNTTSMYKKSQTSVSKRDGDSHQDSTLAYSEMPGGLEENKKYLRGIHTEEQYDKLRKHL